MKYLYTFIGLQDACTHKLILYLQRKEESNRTEVHHEPNHCTVKKGGRERRRRLGERVRQNYNYNAVVQFFPSRQSALRFFPLFLFLILKHHYMELSNGEPQSTVTIIRTVNKDVLGACVFERH